MNKNINMNENSTKNDVVISANKNMEVNLNI